MTLHRFTITRGRKTTPIGNKFLCVDDYGSAVFECHYTSAPVAIGRHRIGGSIVPQANVAYVCSPESMPHEKESRGLFHESEANCNMCAHFSRAPYDKKQFAVSGVFYGRCVINKKIGAFAVAPDDWMGMECWTARLT